MDAHPRRPVRRQPHGQLLFHGPDLDRALETLLPGDLMGLKDGRLRYSMLLGEDGGIIDDLTATPPRRPFLPCRQRRDQGRDIEQFPDRLPRTIAMDHMKEQALLALQGPEAVNVLESLIPGSANSASCRPACSAGMTSRCGSAARATPARTASKSRYARDAEALAQALVADDRTKPIGLARATRSASKRACRSTATISTGRPLR